MAQTNLATLSTFINLTQQSTTNLQTLIDAHDVEVAVLSGAEKTLLDNIKIELNAVHTAQAGVVTDAAAEIPARRTEANNFRTALGISRDTWQVAKKDLDYSVWRSSLAAMDAVEAL